MQDDKDDLTGTRNNNRIPSFIEERDPTPLAGNVVSLWKMIVYYLYDSCMKTNDMYQLLSESKAV